MGFDFLKNAVMREDMELIFNLREWDVLKGKSVYISGAAGMMASYLTMFLIYLNECHNFSIILYAGVRSENKAHIRFGRYVARDYFNLITEDVIHNFPIDTKIDYIIHAASPASPQYYGGNPVETMLPNVVGTYQLLEHAKKFGVDSFLFFSSGTIYGEINSDKIFESDSGIFNFMAPGSVYGESKRCGEALMQAYFREYDVPARAVRINHVYGPTLDLQSDHRAFAEFVKNIVDRTDIILMSDGRQKRAFCYITDAVLAIFTVLLDGAPGESYNLANESQFVSILELAEILVSLYPEYGLKVVRKTRNEKGYLSLAQTNDVVCDTTKIQGLGCHFSVSIREGIYRTIQSFLQRRDCGEF